MVTWNLLFLFIAIPFSITLKLLHHHLSPKPRANLPPGPPPLPLLGNVFLPIGQSILHLGATIRRLRAIYGPVITLYIGSHPFILITNHDVAHQALVEKAAAFADRPPPLGVSRIYSSNGHNISSAAYGPLWRLLRLNLMSGILHPSRIKSFTQARELALGTLITNLRTEANSCNGVIILDNSILQHPIFQLLIIMFFGYGLSDEAIKDVEGAHLEFIGMASKLVVFEIWPRVAKLFLPRRWNRSLEIRQKLEAVVFPLIRDRRNRNQNDDDDDGSLISYLDTLLDLELPEEGGRKVNEDEIVSLCAEFLSAGADTTSTALQWIMANLVKHEEVQKKIWKEIQEVVGQKRKIREEDLRRMPYLKAVILEGLRRHPPAPHLLLHAVPEEVSLSGYLIPKGATVNFAVGEMGRDETVWEEPMEFKPERFLAGGSGEGMDITGSKKIKMMPFGAGRRICPGLGLAMLHLEYFVANLVWEFEWKAVEGEDVDLSEEMVFTAVMKNPPHVRIFSRTKV